MHDEDWEKREIQSQVERTSEQIQKVVDEVKKVIVGQDETIKGILQGMLSGGHVLLEGVPGLAKTLTVKTISEVIDASFKRIQFTPDLLPADIIGTMMYRHQTGEFVARKGPIFSNVILADEINRAPAKVQSALLEAMEEHQVTIGDNTYPLAEPFFVLATQNPIEQEGTYALPEAQLDRFMLKLTMDYPSEADELALIRNLGDENKVSISRLIAKTDIRKFKDLSHKISIDQRLEEYIIRIVSATRTKKKHSLSIARYIEWGVSPRASLHLYKLSKVGAMLSGRSFVVPEDIKKVAKAVLAHRLHISYEAEGEGLSSGTLVDELLSTVPVP